MSNRGSYESMGSGSYNSYESYDGRRGMDDDGDGRYSERRGRDVRGRYTGRDNYSREGENKEQMIAKLERMMSEAATESERQTIMECIRKYERE